MKLLWRQLFVALLGALSEFSHATCLWLAGLILDVDEGWSILSRGSANTWLD
jgi:hypothetical protein